MGANYKGISDGHAATADNRAVLSPTFGITGKTAACIASIALDMRSSCALSTILDLKHHV